MFTLLIVGVFLFAMETTLDQKGVKFKNYWIYTKTHVTCILYYQQFVFKNGGIKISIEYRYMYSVEIISGKSRSTKIINAPSVDFWDFMTTLLVLVCIMDSWSASSQTRAKRSGGLHQTGCWVRTSNSFLRVTYYNYVPIRVHFLYLFKFSCYNANILQ